MRNLLAHAAFLVHFARADRCLCRVEKKIDSRRQVVDLIFRLPDRLAGLRCENGCEAVDIAGQHIAEAAHRADTSFQRQCSPCGLCGACGFVLRRDGPGVVLPQFSNR